MITRPPISILFPYTTLFRSKGALDNDWYQDKLKNYNPRISAGQMSITNYWQAFMTGILPSEAQLYAGWLGNGADLPTAQEWKNALTSLSNWSADQAFTNAVLQLPGLSERAR